MKQKTIYMKTMSWLCVIALLGGMSSSHAIPSDQRLKQIDTIQLESLSESEPVSVQQATSNMVEQIEQPVEMAEERLTLEQVRMATLANNLGLKVDLFAPSVAQTYVDEEKARFEAVFFGGASQSYDRMPGGDSSDTNAPPVRLDTRTTEYTAGIEKKLITGGKLTADFSLNETDKSNNAGENKARVGVSFTQPLLRGARTSINTQPIRVAQINRSMDDAQTKLRMIHLLASADEAYWLLFAARKELEVRREQYELAQNQLDHARKKVASGAAARIEIIRAEAGVASRREAVINSENRVESRHRYLFRIMNRPDLPIDTQSEILPQTRPNPVGLDLNRTKLIDHALDNRMDLIQLDMRLMIDELDLKTARDRLLPSLDFTAAYNLTGQAGGPSDSLEDLNENPSENTFVGLSFSVPLGNRANKARLRRAELDRLVHEAERKDLEQYIQKEVLDAVSALESSWQRILAAEQGVEAAERDYRVEEAQFQLGVRTSTDVLQATTRLAGSKLSRIRAFVDYEIARINLARATGTLLGLGKIMIDPITS